MKAIVFFLLLFSLSVGYDFYSGTSTIKEATIEDRCNGPDAPIDCNFLGQPSNITASVTIGQTINLSISGQIKDATTQAPLAGVILYIYHTDEKGLYTKKGTETGVQRWHGHLHGWCKTDELGNYEIRTLRPAPYPSGDIPAHIHPVFKLPNGQMFFGNDFVFADDVLVDDRYVQNLNNPENPNQLDDGIIDLVKRGGIDYGTRTIFLKTLTQN